MHNGILTRNVEFTNAAGKRFKLSSSRFVSIKEQDTCVVKYSLTPVSSNSTIEYEPYLDGDVSNEDSNYDENFWSEVEQSADNDTSSICMETYKTGYQACAAMKPFFFINSNPVESRLESISLPGYVSKKFKTDINQGDKFTIEKYVAIEVSLYHAKEDLPAIAKSRVKTIAERGFASIMQEHATQWHQKWQESDIVVDGDVSAQQAIRYNIFQLYQTYTGDDPRLNIGPKGFTGEKYGGVTYWDTAKSYG